MNLSSLLIAVIIAFGFASWPIVGGFSKASGAWVGTIVMSATAVAVVLFSTKNLVGFSALGYKSVMYLIVAGLINGLACYLYSVKVADKEIQLGLFVALVAIFVIIMTPCMDWAVNDTLITPKQIAGLCLASVSVYLLAC